MIEILKSLINLKTFSIVSYIIGILTYVFTETITNVKYYDGGFLNIGYSTHDNRNATTIDMWKGLIWPILLLWWFTKVFTEVLHLLLGLFLLIFGIKYKNSKLYKKIENKLLDSV